MAAAFDAQYAPAPGSPRKPATLAIPTSFPARAARMAGRNGWNECSMPTTFVSRIARNVALSSTCSVSVPREMPALAITMSAAP